MFLMQQFQLPQFIEVEDKMFGPLSIRQFIFLAGGAGLIYLLFQLLPQILAVLLTIPVGGLVISLAFVKINGQSFIKVFQAFLSHAFSAKMMLWSKNPAEKTVVNIPDISHTQPVVEIPRPQKKLNNIAWSLDVLDSNKRYQE